MAVPDLINVPSTPQEMLVFSFAHMAHHRDVNAAILHQHNVALPEYALDPMDLSKLSAWSYLHQVMHDNNDAVLGVSGFDLTDINWDNPQQLASWVWLNYQLHYQEAQASGAW